MAGKLLLVNPRKRTRAKTPRKTPVKTKITARRASPVRRKKTITVRRRRNPIAKRNIMASQITPAFTAATGALGLDIMLGILPIPDTIKSGAFRHVVKGAGAIAMGMLVANLVNRKVGEQMATGALTVVMHGAMKEVAQASMPNLQLGYYNAGAPAGVGEYVNELGAYVPDHAASSYLADPLSSSFAGESPAQVVEARMSAGCSTER